MPLIITILLLLIITRIAGEIAERFNQPAMIGEIFAGILLGPSVLNIVSINHELTTIANLGVLLLVFLMGFETDIDDVLDGFGRKNIWISIVGFVIPLAVGVVVGEIMELDIMRTIFIGLCMAITALPVTIGILTDIGETHSNVGKRIISTSLANDVLTLFALGIILSVKNNEGENNIFNFSILLTLGETLLFIVSVFIGWRIIRSAIRFLYIPSATVYLIISKLKGKESLFALVLLYVLIFAALSEAIGFHFIIGTFFGALLLNQEVMGKKNFEQVKSTASGITMGFLAPIFFATIGLTFNVATLTNWTMLVVILAAAFLAKILAGLFGGKIAGMTLKESWTLGIGLNGRGVIEIVIANIALGNGFIGERLFTILVFMGIMTTLITPSLLKLAFNMQLKKNNTISGLKNS